MKRYSYLAALLLVTAPLVAASGDVQTIELKGDSYTVSSTLPSEIIGTYEYEGKGEPIVQINADGTGLFQPHGMQPIAIDVWIDVDETGEPRRQVGTEQRYRYTLLVRYKEGGGGNYPAGSYDLMGVTMLKDEGIAIVLGERTRQLN